jgi:phosphatidyl-myo-inositol alpha-mannosyltransferase
MGGGYSTVLRQAVRRHSRAVSCAAMKVGIVVPYSWSFWGAVIEHAELQAESLQRLGVETRTIMGNDPEGSFTRVLHPRLGRHGAPPPDVIPVGRSVIVPANGSLPNIVLSPRSVGAIRRAFERERFDVVHVHEPMTPAIAVAALALARVPCVATFHAHGPLGWMKIGKPLWGFLADRLDYRIAVSPHARETAAAWLPGEYEVVPNGVLIPPDADPSGREHQVLFAGRQEPRKGLHVLVRAWPEVRRRTGARLRIAGADPLAVRLLLSRDRVSDDGIDVLGFLSQDDLTAELLRAKALVAPSLGGESFGMVLTRAFACATPVLASDIDGYREVMTEEVGVTFPAGDEGALADSLVRLLEDEPRRVALGVGARELAIRRYSWDPIARRLLAIYELITGRSHEVAAAS